MSAPEYHTPLASIDATLQRSTCAPSPVLEGGNASHGMAVSADGKRLVVDSRLNSAVYVYSPPDFKILGSVDVGRARRLEFGVGS